MSDFALDEATLVNSSMLSYLAMVVSVIEGCVISCEDLLNTFTIASGQSVDDLYQTWILAE